MKILKKLALSILFLFFLAFGFIAFNQSQTFAADTCTGTNDVWNKKYCILEVTVKNSDGDPINGVPVVKWQNPSKGDNEPISRGVTNKERSETKRYEDRGKNGVAIFWDLPSASTYKVRVNPPDGWECVGDCEQTNITLSGNNKKQIVNFTLRETGGDDGNTGQCQAVAPQFDPSELSKFPNDNGKVMFKFDLKNNNSRKCGESTYNLSPKDLPDGWSPVFKGTIDTGDKVKDLRYGKTRKDIKLVVTPPNGFSGNESFTVEAQDSENTDLKATIALTATVGDGGDNGDDGDDEDGGGAGGTLHLRIGLDGIGNTGDRQNPTCRFSNKEPETASINVVVRLIRASDNTIVGPFENVEAQYEASSEDEDCSPIPTGDEGRYVADINLPDGFTTGGYFIEVASDKPFRDQRSGLVNLTADTTNSPADPVNLPVGDINGDDVINVADWSLLNECLKRGRSPSCTQNNTTYKIDLNDDGKIFNEVGFWLREFFRLE